VSARILQGDATRAADWDRALAGERANALITDPPYCILTRRKKSGEVREKKDRKIERGPLRRFENVREYREFTRAWLKLAAERLVPTAAMVVWTNLLGKEPIIASAGELGWLNLRGEFVWGKRTREGNSGEEILRVVEVALVLTRDAPAPAQTEDPAVPWAVVAGYDDEQEGKRWGSHPSHKPFGVLEPLIRAWSRPDRLVVDPFAGSGSIPLAAARLGRRAVGLELDEEWADVGQRRLAEALK
jgi:site-specific DNA-methyltransferase (adenine-specific)